MQLLLSIQPGGAYEYALMIAESLRTLFLSDL